VFAPRVGGKGVLCGGEKTAGKGGRSSPSTKKKKRSVPMSGGRKRPSPGRRKKAPGRPPGGGGGKGRSAEWGGEGRGGHSFREKKGSRAPIRKSGKKQSPSTEKKDQGRTLSCRRGEGTQKEGPGRKVPSSHKGKGGGGAFWPAKRWREAMAAVQRGKNNPRTKEELLFARGEGGKGDEKTEGGGESWLPAKVLFNMRTFKGGRKKGERRWGG